MDDSSIKNPQSKIENGSRLIDHAFPLRQASLDSVHEKNVRHGHISTLHIRPARRPLAACRAALIATLLPDPSAEPKPEGMSESAWHEEVVRRRRELCEKIGGKLVKRIERKKMPSGETVEREKEETEGGILHWGRERENKETLDWFRQEIKKAYGGRAPKVLDPFAGGGAIPLEAMRFGCEATAVDINPVAWFILKCTLEYPQKLAGKTRPLPAFILDDREFMESFFKSKGMGRSEIEAALKSLGHQSASAPTLFSPIENLQSPIENLQSPIENLQSPIENLQSPIENLQSPIENQKSKIKNIISSDLAWHVRAWGKWVLNRARKELAPLYPTYAEFMPVEKNSPVPFERQSLRLVPLRDDGTPDIGALNAEFSREYLGLQRNPRWVAKPTVAYLWARTVTCKNCRATVPLLKTRWLCKKDKKRVLLTLAVEESATEDTKGTKRDENAGGGDGSRCRLWASPSNSVVDTVVTVQACDAGRACALEPRGGSMSVENGGACDSELQRSSMFRDVPESTSRRSIGDRASFPDSGGGGGETRRRMPGLSEAHGTALQFPASDLTPFYRHGTATRSSTWDQAVSTSERLQKVAFGIEKDVPVEGVGAARRREYDKLAGAGTMSRSGAKCPCCGTIMTMEDIRLEGRAGRLGSTMTAVVVDGRDGKEYRLPTVEERSVAEGAEIEERLKEVFAKIPFGLPEEPTPKGGSGASRAFSVDGYGFDQWKKLFTPRQLLALGTFVKWTREARDEMGHLTAEWYQAVSAALTVGMDRIADRQSNLCRWDNTRDNLQGTFTRFALPILWDYCEGNPFSETTGNYLANLEWAVEVFEHAMTAGNDKPKPIVRRQSATEFHHDGFDCVVTDPPYYDAISYSDLMDFFYIWLRRALKGLSLEFDNTFVEPLSPKWDAENNDGELIDDSSRHGGDRGKSKQVYEDGMARVFKSCCAALKPTGRLVIVFAHKHPDAWETLVSAIIRAGFVVDGSWPIQTEMPNRTRGLSSAALSSSVWLVCKKRPETAKPGWDNQVLGEMRRNIRVKLREFWDAGIRGPDFVWAATGPAMEAYSQHPVVKKANEPGVMR